MKGKEFIAMMRQDIATDKDKEVLDEVVDAMEQVVNANPYIDIISDGKTPQDCYTKMANFAQKHGAKAGNGVCIGTKKTLEFVADYLGVTAPSAASAATSGIVNLEDFLG
jgi:hypothetical protein